MTTATLEATTDRTAVERTVPAPIPFTRVMRVELLKMFNTRSGFWLMVSIAAAGVIATAAVVIFAPDSAITYDSFGAAIGVPMTILLPIMAALSVTSEWSQRSGLTTFTLVPHRNRVIAAKAIDAVLIGVVSIAVALAVGAVGNLVGAGIAGVSPVWNISFAAMLQIVLANSLGLMVGFMLGVLLRNSPGAIVGYFVFNFVVPTLSMLLAASQDWWKHAQPWLDFNYAQGALYNNTLSGTEWANLGTSALIWLVAPLALGLWLLRRSEVK